MKPLLFFRDKLVETATRETPSSGGRDEDPHSTAVSPHGHEGFSGDYGDGLDVGSAVDHGGPCGGTDPQVALTEEEGGDVECLEAV